MNVALIFSETFSPRDDQLAAFRSQLDIAVKAQKPVFLHQRDAHTKFVEVLEDYRSELTGGVAHCFTGGPAELQRYLELGLHIGITGWICDERRGAELREAVGAIPMNRLLLETDAPYLLPRDIKTKPAARRNEPALLPHILLRLASEMGQDPDLVAAASTENAERLFNLMKAEPSP